ncbi:DUF7019 family protein [Actinacidiphila paucisporea]|uniref:Uncharacterized protein n=1 Tax=Actinacidiphila paucisporea TaxID=310782 RepID=A0A1M7MI34_9ACTN|nr:hypothetical protein [Actinacidiphila paucisporea]SHM90530.1 hypothetical protein SAMN05216499_11650 [Actinacidiphila paucisporea]
MPTEPGPARLRPLTVAVDSDSDAGDGHRLGIKDQLRAVHTWWADPALSGRGFTGEHLSTEPFLGELDRTAHRHADAPLTTAQSLLPAWGRPGQPTWCLPDPGHRPADSLTSPGRRLPMRWGAPAAGRASLVPFGGRTERTIVGLGGANGHVPDPPAAALTNGTDQVSAPTTMPGLISGPATAIAADSEAVPPDALASVCLVNCQLPGVEREVESLDERLSHLPSRYHELDVREGMTVLLGSPLFVALAG